MKIETNLTTKMLAVAKYLEELPRDNKRISAKESLIEFKKFLKENYKELDDTFIASQHFKELINEINNAKDLKDAKSSISIKSGFKAY